MKFTAFLHKKLMDLLNDRRIVVWYDSEGDFNGFAESFSAPDCEVLSSADSVLKARRRADEIYRLMNESDNPAERDPMPPHLHPRPQRRRRRREDAGPL